MMSCSSTLRCLLVVTTLLSYSVSFTTAQDDFIYCGDENCYEILEVDPKAEPKAIKKAYRKLALKHHPDRGGETAVFQSIANAYEVLSDAGSRRDYDYVLKHPEEFYANRMRYYRHRATPKVSVAPIIIITLTLISVGQWFFWNNRHIEAIDGVLREPKLRNQAKAKADAQGLFFKGMKKDQLEEVLRGVVAESIVQTGTYGKANVWDLAWVKVLLIPYTVAMYLKWKGSWYYRITVSGQEYTEEDRMYLLCYNMGFSSARWDAFTDEEKEVYIEEELWDAETCVEYQHQQDLDAHEKIKNSSRYKMYKRWRKSEGRN